MRGPASAAAREQPAQNLLWAHAEPVGLPALPTTSQPFRAPLAKPPMPPEMVHKRKGAGVPACTLCKQPCAPPPPQEGPPRRLAGTRTEWGATTPTVRRAQSCWATATGSCPPTPQISTSSRPPSCSRYFPIYLWMNVAFLHHWFASTRVVTFV
ncbi:F-box/LRR-repeat protein 17-like [Bos indicus x Bos taurus]|uniref:F-box/LRR-repeat protein 17-like n=1 Tax=Bos indicus x Bos taurus TaxID=30522 RepID=UPI000D532079|nr:F-box/LRR-repeat protein 17-like [Bos indicus x Bos taurus]